MSSQLIIIPPSINSFWDLPTIEDAQIKWGEVSCNGSQKLTIVKRVDMTRPQSVLNPSLEMETRFVKIEGWTDSTKTSNGWRRCKAETYRKLKAMPKNKKNASNKSKFTVKFVY